MRLKGDIFVNNFFILLVVVYSMLQFNVFISGCLLNHCNLTHYLYINTITFNKFTIFLNKQPENESLF